MGHVSKEVPRQIFGRLLSQPGLDESTALVGEFMHVVCLGVIKQLLIFWTTRPGPWSLRPVIDKCDIFLENIKVPSFFFLANYGG